MKLRMLRANGGALRSALPMPTGGSTYLERGLTIGVLSIACALLSMLVALAVFIGVWGSDGDSATAEPLIVQMLDPLVFLIAAPIALATAVLAFPLAFLLLVRTPLQRSVPVVFGATLLGVALGGLLLPFLGSVLGGLVLGLASMFWCKLNLQADWQPGAMNWD